MFCSIINGNTFEFVASQIYAYDMRKSNFSDFQGIFLSFPDFSKNAKFPWPYTTFPTLFRDQ